MEFYKHCISTPVIQKESADNRMGKLGLCTLKSGVSGNNELKSPSRAHLSLVGIGRLT